MAAEPVVVEAPPPPVYEEPPPPSYDDRWRYGESFDAYDRWRPEPAPFRPRRTPSPAVVVKEPPKLMHEIRVFCVPAFIEVVMKIGFYYQNNHSDYRQAELPAGLKASRPVAWKGTTTWGLCVRFSSLQNPSSRLALL